LAVIAAVNVSLPAPPSMKSAESKLPSEGALNVSSPVEVLYATVALFESNVSPLEVSV
jgi:hypothetical protein